MANEIFCDTVLKMKEQQRKVPGERHHLNSQKTSIFSSVATLSAERARLKEPVNW